MKRNLRGRVRVRGGRGGRGGQRRQRTVISDEIRATVIDHVLVHGMSMREAGQRVQPNISRFTVSTIIRRFREENRLLPFFDIIVQYVNVVSNYCMTYYILYHSIL